MSIKRIIVFILCALMLYAGGFCVYYGFEEWKKENSRYVVMTDSDLPNLINGCKATASIYQQVMFMGTEVFQPEILNIPIGKPVEWHRYLVPLQYEKDASKHKYYIVCVSEPESIERMEQLSVILPQPEEGEPFVIKGVSKIMDLSVHNEIYSVISSRRLLVGVDGLLKNPTEAYYHNRIIDWVVYEQNASSAYITAFIAGGVLCVVGIGMAVLMIIKIYREKHWY